jgi:cobalamin biosynthesis Mg chelatase CobN
MPNQIHPMKQISTVILVTILVMSSCSIIHKQTQKDHNKIDSTGTQVSEFVEYKIKDSLGTIQGIDSTGKVTHNTWHDETTIHELFDSNGKVTNRITHKTSRGTGTIREKSIKGQTQQTKVKTSDSTSNKNSTTGTIKKELEHTELKKVSKTSPLPWWILVIVGVVFLVYMECPQLPMLFIALFKRKKENNNGNI